VVSYKFPVLAEIQVQFPLLSSSLPSLHKTPVVIFLLGPGRKWLCRRLSLWPNRYLSY